MSQIVVFHPKSSSTLTLDCDVYSIASAARLTVSGPVGEFKSLLIRLEGPPNKTHMNKVVNSVFELAEPVAKVVVDEDWEELKQDFFKKYNAMTF